MTGAALTLTLIAAFGLFVASYLRLHARVGHRIAVVLLSARAVALVTIAYLLWVMFWRPERSLDRDVLPPDRSPLVVVLEDASDSMELRSSATATTTRSVLANQVWQDVKRYGDDFPTVHRIEHLYFADSLSADRGGLGTESSRISDAVSKVLTRTELASLLIVSDGATTDGIVPRHFLRWARNRGVTVASVCAIDDDSPLTDRGVLEATSEARNPDRVVAEIVCSGSDRQPVRVQFSIDGANEQTVEMSPATRFPVMFKVPALDPGWHEYAIDVEATEREATIANNRFVGVFRVVRGQRVLLVYERPDVEVLQLSRLLRDHYGQVALIARSQTLLTTGADTDIDAFAVAILAGVDPASLPKELRDAIDGDRVSTIVLPNAQPKALGSLLRDVVVSIDDTATYCEQSAVVQISQRDRVKSRLEGGVEGLAIDHLYRAIVQSGAEPLYFAATEGSARPAIVVDHLSRPRRVALLIGSTWKWSRDPDRKTQYGYQRFWLGLLRWLIDEQQDDSRLKIELASDKGGAGRSSGTIVRGRIVPKFRDPGSVVGLALDVEGGEVRSLVARGSRHEFVVEATGDARVLWLDAHGEFNHEAVASARVPIAVNPDAREFTGIVARPDVLAQFGESGDSARRFADRQPVVEHLFREQLPEVVDVTSQRRGGLLEFLVALGLALVMAAEWWLERRLQARLARST